VGLVGQHFHTRIGREERLECDDSWIVYMHPVSGVSREFCLLSIVFKESVTLSRNQNSVITSLEMLLPDSKPVMRSDKSTTILN
jgi:hypothetical protein